MYCLVRNVNTKKIPTLLSKTFSTKEEAKDYVFRYMEKTPHSNIEFTIAELNMITTYKSRLVEEIRIG